MRPWWEVARCTKNARLLRGVHGFDNVAFRPGSCGYVRHDNKRSRWLKFFRPALDFLYTFPAVSAPNPQGALTLDWGGRDPYHQSHPIAANGATAFPQLLPGALSQAECAQVVALGQARLQRAATVDQRSDLASRDYRVSDIAWIAPDADAQWLFHRLALLFTQVNASYRFELLGFVEALQFTSYGPGQYFGWHVDIGGDDTASRKLSLTVQLSDPAAYDGGDLAFHGAAEMPIARERGCATFFPSYLAHQVTPVTRGLRRSLVAWAYGPAFR